MALKHYLRVVVIFLRYAEAVRSITDMPKVTYSLSNPAGLTPCHFSVQLRSPGARLILQYRFDRFFAWMFIFVIVSLLFMVVAWSILADLLC